MRKDIFTCPCHLVCTLIIIIIVYLTVNVAGRKIMGARHYDVKRERGQGHDANLA
jgi:hypothetical protein